MFDGCRKWRDCMDALQEGNLSPEDCAGLQSHLQECPACDSLFAADALRRSVLQSHSGIAALPNSRSFDDGIISALRVPAPPEPLAPRSGLRALLRLLPTDFMRQMAGGTMLAAAVTFICLFTALHPKHTAWRQSPAPSHAAPNEPPVALEELLRAHSPRAASLWSNPAATANRPPRPAPAAHPARPKDAGRHGSVNSSGRVS